MYKTKHTMVILCIVHNVYYLYIIIHCIYIYKIIFSSSYTTINKLLFLCEKNT